MTIRFYSLKDQVRCDERGRVVFPFESGLDLLPKNCDLTSLHLVSTEAGAVRGNHRHPNTAEWLHVVDGALTLYWEEDGRVQSKQITGANDLVYIPAGTPHAIKNTGKQSSLLMAVREKNPSGPHTETYPIV